MPGHGNVAASLGRWSARHRVWAVAGRLVMVVVTMMIGAAVGQLTLTRAEYGVQSVLDAVAQLVHRP